MRCTDSCSSEKTVLFTIEKTNTAATICHMVPCDDSHSIAQQIDPAAMSSTTLRVPGIFRLSSSDG